jgi:Ni/Co efflux regulator RcnB
MKTKILMTTITAVAIAFSGLAFAKGKGGDGDDDNRGKSKQDKFEKREDKRQEKFDKREEHAERHGAGPDHDFYRGGRLPIQYRDRGYWVDDWRGHRLSAPPRGYHWVQTGGDYVLVADSNNIILQILLGR